MEVDYIKEWNNTYPHLAVTGQKTSAFDSLADDSEPSTEWGDKLLSATNIYRNKIINPQMWPANVTQFKQKWDAFKKNIGAVDFTDLIENAITDLPYAPGRPEVLFVDEAQDFTKLQLKLARNWGMEMKWIVLVGDDDQTIYRFTGADPYAFLLPAVPDNRKTVLKQSYRIPQAVLERSTDLIEKINDREQKKYMARKDKDGKTVIGEVIDRNFGYNRPDTMIAEAADYANDNKSVMILTSCSFMLDYVKAQLRNKGIPFANRYRQNRGDWNPLVSKTNGVSAKDLLIAFKNCGSNEPYWNVPQFVTWAQFVKTGPTGVLRGTAKKFIKFLKQAVKDNEPDLHSTENVIKKVLSPAAIKPALDRNIEWLVENLVKSRITSINYPIKVMNNFGMNAVTREPKITIGTIHSVKGAEADIVYLFPDISWQATKEYETDVGKDAIHRVFYVGMTRARSILNIGEAASSSPHKQNKPSVKF
jgi:superfamily I DNA/RNA helicase